MLLRLMRWCRWRCGRARRPPLSGSVPACICRSAASIRAGCCRIWRAGLSAPTADPATWSLIRCAAPAPRWWRPPVAAAARSGWTSSLGGSTWRPATWITSSTRPPGRAEVRVGDARRLPGLLSDVAGRVDLVATSPPYMCDAGVIDKPAWIAGARLCDRAAMAAVYAACHAVLRPGGLLVTVTKNMRRHGRLVDLAAMTRRLAVDAGLGYLQHVVALHAGIRDGRLVARPSFWQHLGGVRHRRSQVAASALRRGGLLGGRPHRQRDRLTHAAPPPSPAW